MKDEFICPSSVTSPWVYLWVYEGESVRMAMCVCRWVMMAIIEAVKLKGTYGSAEMIEGPSIYLPANTHTHIHTLRHEKQQYTWSVCNCVYVWRTNSSTFSHQTDATALQVCLLHYQKVRQVEADKMNRQKMTIPTDLMENVRREFKDLAHVILGLFENFFIFYSHSLHAKMIHASNLSPKTLPSVANLETVSQYS